MELNKLVNQGRAVQAAIRRRTFALECAEIYRDLVLGEDILRWDVERNSTSRSSGTMTKTTKNQEDYDYDNEEEEDDDDDGETFESVELLNASSLERVAYTALYLLQELQSSSEEVSAIALKGSSSNSSSTATTTAAATEDAVTSNEQQLQLPSLKDDNNYSSSANGINSAIIEKSKYLMKLSPRIRRLESDAVKCLVGRLEGALIALRNLSEEEDGNAEKDEEGKFFK